jgi:phage gp45-like
MKELSPKSAIFAVFCMVILGSCVPAGGLAGFLNDDTVKGFVDTLENVVLIDDLTGDKLRGRDGRIEGLNPRRYYMIEKEVDADGNNVPSLRGSYNYPVFATDLMDGPGGLYNDLGYITRINRGIIFELYNYHTYTVRAAEVFSVGTNFSYTSASTTNYVSVNNSGAINIPPPSPDIKLSIPNQFYNYNVMAVAVIPPIPPPSKWKTENDGNYISKLINPSYHEFPLEYNEKGSTVDYVFFKKNPIDFKVLRVIIEGQPGALSTVTDLNITQVTNPVAGASPVNNNISSAEYTGTVTWNGNPSTFAANTVYTATITLTAKSGYTFDGVAANSFNVNGATSTNNVTGSGTSITVTAVFPSTGDIVINIAAIAGVTAPATEGIPASAITPNAQYSGTVSWAPAVPTGGTFTAGTQYTATIALTPNAGYTLTGVAANFFTVAGATLVNNDANTGVITAQFPATAANVINIAAIPGVTPPKTGATPVTAITENAQYSGTVTWNGSPSTFAADTVYTATITLTAKPGYTLTGVAADFFTVAGATTTSYTAGSNTVTAIFPRTKQTLTLNINWASPAIPKFVDPGSYTYTQVNYYNGGSQIVKIEIEPSSLNDYVVEKWLHDGGAVFSGTDSTLTLNNTPGNINCLSKGKHVITVVLKNATGIVHSLDFTLTVN